LPRRARARGVKALAVLADVSKRDQVDAMVDQALSVVWPDRHPDQPRRDPAHKPFREVAWTRWEAVRGVVLDGAYYLTRAVIDGMVERNYGRILFFMGEGAFAGGSGRAHVSAAKYGLVGLSRSLAASSLPNNIRVNIVSPGSIDTRRDNPEWYHGQVPNASWHPDGPPGQTRRDRFYLPLPHQRRGRLYHRPDDSTSTAGQPSTEPSSRP